MYHHQSPTDDLQQQQQEQQHEQVERSDQDESCEQDQLSLSSLESELHTGDDYLDELLQQALNSKFFLDDDYQNCIAVSEEEEEDDNLLLEDLDQEETSLTPNADAHAHAHADLDASETVSSDMFDLDLDLDWDLNVDESGRYSSLDMDMDSSSFCEWKNVSKHPKLSTITCTTRKTRTSNPKNLSHLMEQRQWQLIPQRLAKHPQEASQLIFLLPQVAPKGILPLHLACAIRPLPPPHIVKLLLQVYPEAVTEPEANWGMLPLHFAVDLDPSVDFVTGSYKYQPNDETPLPTSPTPDLPATADQYLQHLQQAYFGNSDNEHQHQHQQPIKTAPIPIESIHFHQTFPSQSQEHPQQDNVVDVYKNINTNTNSPNDDQTEIVTMLLDLYPQAITLRETSQGRMPLHIAASTTICNNKGLVPPTSYSIFQILTQNMTHQEIQEPTYAWENAIDMTKRNIKKQKHCHNNDSNHVENWLPHPLLGWQNNNKNHHTKIHTCHATTPEIKKTATDSDTDATSITTSLSYSMSEDTNTTNSSAESPQQMQWKQQWKQQQQKQQRQQQPWGEFNADTDMFSSMYQKDSFDMNENQIAEVSDSDDDCSFYTARSSANGTVKADNTKQQQQQQLQQQQHTLLMSSQNSLLPHPYHNNHYQQTESDDEDDEDDAQSIFTLESNVDLSSDGMPLFEVDTASILSVKSCSTNEACNSVVPFIPRPVVVSQDKILFRFQIHLSNLVRPRQNVWSRALLPTKKINPYFVVELLSQNNSNNSGKNIATTANSNTSTTSTTVLKYVSNSYKKRSEALWEPVEFAFHDHAQNNGKDSSAMLNSLVLQIRVYHKKRASSQHKKDEWVGTFQSSCQGLHSSIAQYPLYKGNDCQPKQLTGQLRLVSFAMTPLHAREQQWKSCW